MIDYIALLFLVVTYLSLVLLTSFSHQYIKFLTIGFTLLYFIWGLWHHKREKSLHPKIILEYLIIAMLGLWLIISIP
ncbi:hypothetical protein KKG65_03530 [Patescibacteria group bacterium]|nr:hypothetical protein [Patescibacteria group bacterium]